MKFSKRNNEITKENINKMVVAFYTKVLKADNDVAKVFVLKLGNDLKSEIWQSHIQTLTDFWAMQTLGEMEYRGNPMMAHFELPLRSEMFTSWLEMFFETIDAFYDEERGEVFKQRANIIANNFKRNLGL